MTRLRELERGRDLSRIEAFSDGVFAIAITLLVLQIEVPTGIHSGQDLWEGIVDEAGDFLAYAISFWVIGVYWMIHHRFMRTIQEFDETLMRLNILLLAVVVLVPFSSQLVGEYGSYQLSMVIYSANLILISAVHWWVQSYVLTAELVKPEFRVEADLGRRSSLFNLGVFALSIPLSFVLMNWTPVVWFLMGLDPFQRRRNRLVAEEKQPDPFAESEAEDAPGNRGDSGG